MIDEKSRVAVVTGGSSGIGLALVKSLHADGCTVFATGRHNDRWQDVLRVHPQLCDVHFRCVDMRDHKGLVSLVDEVNETTNGLDIMINNAGIMPLSHTHELTLDSIAEQLDILLEGPIVLTSAALRSMIECGRSGQIINVSSTVANSAAPQMSVYGAAKAGLVHFTRSIAAEYASHGIRANAICPGAVNTDLAPTVLLDQIARNTPLGRLVRPEEIAEFVLYLLGPSAEYITGSVFTIDGGTSLGPPVSGPSDQTTEAEEPPETKSIAAPPPAKPSTVPDPAVLALLAPVLAKVFVVDEGEIDLATTPNDIDKWDSLGHMNMIGALEKEIGIRFEVDEVMEMTSVVEIVRIVARKKQRQV